MHLKSKDRNIKTIIMSVVNKCHTLDKLYRKLSSMNDENIKYHEQLRTVTDETHYKKNISSHYIIQ